MDRRIERTRRALHKALLQLTLERGWDDVSVQEVCAHANIGRSTFYVHFADKEELLLTGFADLRRTLAEHVARQGKQPLVFTRHLFEQAHAHEPLRPLLRKRTAHIIHRAFIEVVTDFLRADVADVPPGPALDAAVRYMAGAFWELFRWWCDESRTTSAQEVDEIFRRLTMPVLHELRSGRSGALPAALCGDVATR